MLMIILVDSTVRTTLANQNVRQIVNVLDMMQYAMWIHMRTAFTVPFRELLIQMSVLETNVAQVDIKCPLNVISFRIERMC